MTELAPALACHQISHVNRFLHIAARLGQNFAHLASHVAGVVLFARDQNLGSVKQDLGALGRRRQPPLVVRSLRRLDSPFNVLGPGRRKHPDQLIGVRWIAVLDNLAAAGFDPFTVDIVPENFRGRCSRHPSSSQRLLCERAHVSSALSFDDAEIPKTQGNNREAHTSTRGHQRP